MFQTQCTTHTRFIMSRSRSIGDMSRTCSNVTLQSTWHSYTRVAIVCRSSYNVSKPYRHITTSHYS